MIANTPIKPPSPALLRAQLEDTLRHIVSWWPDCLNYHAADKAARSQPSDDDLCELFNRLELGNRVLAQQPNRMTRKRASRSVHQEPAP